MSRAFKHLKSLRDVKYVFHFREFLNIQVHVLTNIHTHNPKYIKKTKKIKISDFFNIYMLPNTILLKLIQPIWFGI